MVVGELNVDIIFSELYNIPEIGKEQKAGKMSLTLGSSSAIFASNISSLGSGTVFCGKIGTDQFGKLVTDTLKQKHVNTDFLIIDDHLQTGATSVYNYSGDRMMVTFPGAMESFTVEEIPDELFEKSRHLHTSSIFLQPGIKQNILSLFQKAKKYGLSTSLDIQWDPKEEWDLNLVELLPFLDFFLPNAQEAVNLTGASGVEEALEYLLPFNSCVVIKQGDKGATLQHNGKRISIPALKVTDFSDAVGAGDSFNAGFLHEYLKGSELDKCLETGNLVAAVSTTEAGGTDAIESYEQALEKGKSFEKEA